MMEHTAEYLSLEHKLDFLREVTRNPSVALYDNSEIHYFPMNPEWKAILNLQIDALEKQLHNLKLNSTKGNSQ